MKTTKLMMITALLSFALMSFANAELGMSKNVISLKAAMSNPQLTKAIHSQVSPLDILNSERAGYYTAQIVLKKTVYLITGTYKDWSYFFRDIDGMSPLCTDKKLPATLVDGDPLFSKKNPFSTSVKRPSSSSEKDPFGDKRKKPMTSETWNKALLDDE
jgi:hypothetical protein